MLGKKIKYLCSFLLFLFISLFLYGENYKIFEINRSEDCYNLINNELSEDYDIQNYFAISSTEKGVHFKQYFYKIMEYKKKLFAILMQKKRLEQNVLYIYQDLQKSKFFIHGNLHQIP